MNENQSSYMRDLFRDYAHITVWARPLQIYYVSTARKLLSAHDRSDTLPLTHVHSSIRNCKLPSPRTVKSKLKTHLLKQACIDCTRYIVTWSIVTWSSMRLRIALCYVGYGASQVLLTYLRTLIVIMPLSIL